MKTVVWLGSGAVQAVLSLREKSFPLETGGVLLGYRRFEEGVEHWVVTTATGPGPNAVHERTRFKPDNDYHEAEALKHFQLYGGSEYYLGDWHTHPNGSAEASWLDRRTLRKNASRAKHSDHRSVMLIVGGAPQAPTYLAHLGVKARFWWGATDFPQPVEPILFH